VPEKTEDRRRRWSRTLRTLALVGTACATGIGATIVLLIGYVIGKLYLSGHSIEPKWYDTVGSFIVFGGGLAAAIAAFILGRRALDGTRPQE